VIKVDEIGLFGVVGFRQPYDTDYAILSEDITTATSGIYFDNYSSYLTVKNLYNTQPYADISDENFNNWLEQVIKSSINKGLQQCFNKNDLIDKGKLFKYSNIKTEELANYNDFVGYELNVSNRNDISVYINKIYTEFAGTGTVKILLFNDLQIEPIQIKEIAITDKSEKETEVNWYLPNTGGKYYVGYLTNGLAVNGIDRDWEKSSKKTDYRAVGVRQVNVKGWDSEVLFDVDDVDYVSETFGLNFDISSYNDYTEFINTNKNMFVDVIGYQFAADMLGMMITSNRTTATERLQKGNLLLELQGNFTNDELPTFRGVQDKLKKAINNIQKQVVDMPQMIITTAK